MKKSIVDQPPGKALRFGLRLPVWMYRARLGWLLGERFLQLTHTGRNSGLPRQTVVEVVHHDDASDTYYIVSGWGEKADWYQNIRKTPAVEISTGWRKFHSTSMFIPGEQAVHILKIYADNHPLAFNELSGLFLGDRGGTISEKISHIAEKMPMVAFSVDPETQRKE